MHDLRVYRKALVPIPGADLLNPRNLRNGESGKGVLVMLMSDFRTTTKEGNGCQGNQPAKRGLELSVTPLMSWNMGGAGGGITVWPLI